MGCIPKVLEPSHLTRSFLDGAPSKERISSNGFGTHPGKCAEVNLLTKLAARGKAGADVKYLYSEYEPCDDEFRGCQRFITNNFPNLDGCGDIQYSFQFRGPHGYNNGQIERNWAFTTPKENRIEEYTYPQNWTWGRLRMFSEEVLESVALPDETKTFLRDYGLPEQYTISTSPEVVSVLLPETGHTTKKWHLLSGVTETLLVFAETIRSPFYGIAMEETMNKVLECLEVGSGKVFLGIYEDNRLHRIELANSSIWQYAQSLVEYLRLMDDVSNGTQADLALERYEHALTEIDPEAMLDFDGRWQADLRLLYVIL